MAVQAIGATNALTAVSRNSVVPVGRSAASGGGQTNSAASTIVVSKITVTNADGSTTTTITYADGHTETERIPAKLSSKQQNSGGSPGTYGGGNAGRVGASSQPRVGAAPGAATGSLVDLLI